MQLTLDKGIVGTPYHVRSIVNEGVASKLLAMGVRAGTSISILRRTFLGSAVCIKSEGFVLALRYSEASEILVEKSPK